MGRAASFRWLRWLAVFLLSLLWATMGSTTALAERSDLGHCSLAANSAPKVAIQFGKVENQVSHAFRHIEAAGLERSAVQSAVQTHLQGAALRPSDGSDGVNQKFQIDEFLRCGINFYHEDRQHRRFKK